MLRNFGPYGVVLYIHSVVRWAIVAAGLYAAARAWRGRLGQHAWLKADTRAGRILVSLMDAQLLIGFVLYVLYSPVIQGAKLRPEMVAGSRGMRFWVFEHPIAAFVAIVIAHIGFLKARKGGPLAHRDAALFYTLALLIVLAVMPWPIFSYGRWLWPIW
jgi:hypothetical protein